MKTVAVVLLGILLASIGLIGFVPQVDAQSEPVLHVAVSLDSLGGIVDVVGRNYVGIDVLLPEGVEPHAAQLPQSAIDAASSADLLVLTGHFTWEEDLANQTGTPFISLEDYEEFGAELSPLPGNHGEEDDHGEGNLHSYWLLPKNAMAIANATRVSLSDLAPSHGNTWEAAFEEFVEDVEEFNQLVSEFEDENHFSELTAVVVFPAEAYVAETFGIEVRAVLQEGDNIFIAGVELLEVQTALSNGSIDIILGSDIARLQAGGESAIQLAEDTGSQVIWWRTAFSAGASNYLSIMTFNLGVLTSSLENMAISGEPTINYISIGIAGFLAVVVVVETVLLYQRIRNEE
ncbi:MAG: zinc ABC transporter substrate-binding protein [Candidatus Thorarchaeota archaeon]|nr:zinc ABC transporter substrate-binding protein [Candidatus Thorarchaeota archaeon]